MLILETFWRRTSCRACHRAVSYFPMYRINNRTQLVVTLTTDLDDLLIGLHIRTRRRMLHIRTPPDPKLPIRQSGQLIGVEGRPHATA